MTRRHILLRRVAETLPEWRARRETSGRIRSASRCIQTPNHAQDLQFVFNRQSVTGLCFDGGRSALQKPLRMSLRLSPATRLPRQLASCAPSTEFRRRPPRSPRRSLPSRAHLEFVHAIPAKNRMRMRIDESRQHHFAGRVDDFRAPAGSSSRSRPTAPVCRYSPSRTSIPPSRMIANSRHFLADTRTFRTGQRDQLRSVENRDRLQNELSFALNDLVHLLKFLDRIAALTLPNSSPRGAAFTFSSFKPAEIDPHVHGRTLDTGPDGKQADADVRNRARDSPSPPFPPGAGRISTPSP